VNWKTSSGRMTPTQLRRGHAVKSFNVKDLAVRTGYGFAVVKSLPNGGEGLSQ
jgi:hypothetical protein